MMLRLLFFLLPLAAWAQPAAVAPPPSKSDIDKAVAFIKADPAMVEMAIRQIAAAMAGQTSAPPTTALPAQTPAAVALLPASPTTAAVPPAVAFALTPELKNAINELILTIIGTATIALGAWARSHFTTVQQNKFMQQVGANEAIDNAQKTQGGLVELALAKQGRSLASVDASDPIVQGAAQTLRGRFQEWGPMVGLTQDIAAQKVLGSAVNQSAVPLVPAAAVAVVQPVPPPLPAVSTGWIAPVAEAAATPQHPPSPPAQGSIA